MLWIITSVHLLLAGTLAITSMPSSRVFMDSDVQPTKDYLEWYAPLYSVICHVNFVFLHFVRHSNIFWTPLFFQVEFQL